jgi:hypothetical protein
MNRDTMLIIYKELKVDRRDLVTWGGGDLLPLWTDFSDGPVVCSG